MTQERGRPPRPPLRELNGAAARAREGLRAGAWPRRAQAAAQPPAPSAPAAQVTPAAQPSPDAQGVAPSPEMPGATYPAPAQAGQPFYVPPAASSPGQAGAPTVPVVISESGAPSPEDASRSKRRNDGARDAASGSQPSGSRDDAGRDT